MSLIEDLAGRFRTVLADARELVDDGRIKAAIDGELHHLEGLAQRGEQFIATHIANWFTGAYTAVDGGVSSPAGQNAPGSSSSAPAPASPQPTIPLGGSSAQGDPTGVTAGPPPSQPVQPAPGDPGSVSMPVPVPADPGSSSSPADPGTSDPGSTDTPAPVTTDPGSQGSDPGDGTLPASGTDAGSTDPAQTTAADGTTDPAAAGDANSTPPLDGSPVTDPAATPPLDGTPADDTDAQPDDGTQPSAGA